METETAPEKTTIEKSITTRTLKSASGQEYNFPFLVVDSPDKWPEAASFCVRRTIPNTKIGIPIRGISYEDFDRIQEEYAIPAAPEPKSPGYEALRAAREDAILAKEVALIEISTGMKIPGDDSKEKVEFVKAKGKSDVDGLLSYVQDFGCCWVEGDAQTPLVSQYQSLCEEESVESATPFAMWSDAKDSSYSFIFQRPHDNFICEFPLRGISSEKDTAIRKATDPGEPECIPYKDPISGRISGVRHNPNDHKWLKRANKMQKKALILYLEATLPFSIPGETEEERAKWLGKRLIGDVAALKRYIDRNVTSFGASLSFF